MLQDNADCFDPKFVCIFCDYGTSHKGKYDHHLATHKHKKNKCLQIAQENNSSFFSCCLCHFYTSNTTLYHRHLETDKHNKRNVQYLAKQEAINQKYRCEKCDYVTFKKSSYVQHMASKKHEQKMIQKEDPDILKERYTCHHCKKEYMSRAGLWGHTKKCTQQSMKPLTEVADKDMIVALLKQNSELQKQMLELASKPSTIVNHHTKNIHNKQFNIQVYLNETCKNAMNLSDFVSSLVIRNEEFENMGKLGYVQGISNILIRGLRELDETKRPMHCTDKKRETLYIKENNVWNKELSREKMKQLVLDVSFKNVRNIPVWKADHPECDDTSSQKYMDYIKILNQVMTGIHPDSENDINKIIRNVSHEVIVGKASTIRI